jgi:hypothetical protein
MKTKINVLMVDEREQWRARILRALDELRGGDDSIESLIRQDDDREDAPAESTNV